MSASEQKKQNEAPYAGKNEDSVLLTKSWTSSVDVNGKYKRKPSAFRDSVTADGSSDYKAEAGRYHLYVSYACPWAHRTLAVRHLKGLTKVIGVTVVDPLLVGKYGWSFDTENDPDPHHGFSHLREVYMLTDESYQGNITVPVLYDTKTQRIVNNESSEIIRMLNTEFNEFCETDEQRTLHLYPEHLRKAIDKVNDWVYPTINNGVYKCGFAKTQEAYEDAYESLKDGLERANELLSKQRYLASNTEVTEADIRLFTTLVRFDAVYNVHFKCNMGTIRHDYPALYNHTLEMYQWRGLGEATVNMDHIKRHYYMSHESLNPRQIVPLFTPTFTAKHNRDEQF
eukprot:TRINITY_DN104142_c0_g1_i1.p1 TRINITY_DN104142_c0_g1~~TRINITY_DN104142_c0_g1_i1.p1  ORF type:complete len:353 (-),score=142.54 TRINITY_DN104142_c0_g1_i1:713-1735(-)